MSFPTAMPAPPPVSNVFHQLAARQLAGRGGRPASPAPLQSAGAPVSLMASGRPPAPAGHAPPMMTR